jgi:hypothetical protein
MNCRVKINEENIPRIRQQNLPKKKNNFTKSFKKNSSKKIYNKITLKYIYIYIVTCLKGFTDKSFSTMPTTLPKINEN